VDAKWEVVNPITREQLEALVGEDPGEGRISATIYVENAKPETIRLIEEAATEHGVVLHRVS
jgi:hypothetical protein